MPSHLISHPHPQHKQPCTVNRTTTALLLPNSGGKRLPKAISRGIRTVLQLPPTALIHLSNNNGARLLVLPSINLTVPLLPTSTVLLLSTSKDMVATRLSRLLVRPLQLPRDMGFPLLLLLKDNTVHPPLILNSHRSKDSEVLNKVMEVSLRARVR